MVLTNKHSWENRCIYIAHQNIFMHSSYLKCLALMLGQFQPIYEKCVVYIGLIHAN